MTSTVAMTSRAERRRPAIATAIARIGSDHSRLTSGETREVWGVLYPIYRTGRRGSCWRFRQSVGRFASSGGPEMLSTSRRRFFISLLELANEVTWIVHSDLGHDFLYAHQRVLWRA